MRRCAGEPLVAELETSFRFDTPLRLFAGVHYLVLGGEEPDLARAYAGEGDAWAAFRDVLARRRDFLARFVAERPSNQTNEVGRCFALLPAFLTVAGHARGLPLDLLELGPSGGLNLVWDRYRYRYEAGAWGPGRSPLTLAAAERGRVPSGLLGTPVEVRRRRGIDLDPIDVRTDEGARLLLSFLWPDQPARFERARRAIEAVREDPPELIRGDYVELLPGVLGERHERVLTVVFQTVSTVYLAQEARARLTDVLERAGAEGPLAVLSTRIAAEEAKRLHDSYELELRLWPGGAARVVARFHTHGDWLDWLG